MKQRPSFATVAADHAAEVPKGEGEQGVVVMAAAARTAVAVAVLAAAGRDGFLSGGFGHGMNGFIL